MSSQDFTPSFRVSCELTAERLRDTLEYNQITGKFFRKVSVKSFGGRCGTKKQEAGAEVGTKVRPDGYIRFTFEGHQYMAHRLAWLYVHGEFPKQEIDHIDGNRSNNAITNLRLSSRKENNQNRHKARKDSSSNLIGAFLVKGRDKKKWRSTIRADGKIKHLGYFDTEEDAHLSYCAAKKIFHPSSDLKPMV